jgi:hypothetical protein
MLAMRILWTQLRQGGETRRRRRERMRGAEEQRVEGLRGVGRGGCALRREGKHCRTGGMEGMEGMAQIWGKGLKLQSQPVCKGAHAALRLLESWRRALRRRSRGCPFLTSTCF